MIDLRFNYPVLDAQHAEFFTSLAALPPSPDYLRMPPPGGHPADRAVAAQWLSRPGFAVNPEWLQLGCGGHQALAAIVLATRLAGCTVAVDAITYNGFLALAGQFNINVVACAFDEAGMLPDALVALCRAHAIRAIYLMPTLHNPLTLVMPLARREALVQVAREFGLLVLDDDAYGFLEPSPPPSFAHLAPERGFLIYSLAKVVAPGVKLAYIVAPPAYQTALGAAIRATSSGTSVLFARYVSALITNGKLAQLIEEKRHEARRRQAIARQVLGPTAAYHTRPTSFHLWWPLPGSTNVAALGETLLTHGVDVVTSLVYQADPARPQPGIRLALGSVPDDATLTEGLRIVARHLPGW